MTHDEERHRLLTEKHQIVVKMHDLENKLMGLKNECRRKGSMPQGEYNKILTNQVKYRQAVIDLERTLGPIKNRLIEIADDDFEKKHALPVEISADPTMVRAVVELRQHYQEFAADGTRVGSMRQMAAEFVLKLNEIIKQEINGRPKDQA